MQNNWLELQNPKSEGTLTATHFEGVEGLTQDFKFLIEGDSATELSAKDWLGNGVTLTIHTTSQGSRTFHGIVSEFEAGNYNAQKERHYQLILSPWLYALRFIQDCRIFQNISVPQIFRTLCQEAGFFAIDISHIELRSYPKRVYCVQYNETTYDFLHRLLGEEGIYYAYEYDEGKHTLVLYDANSPNPAQMTEFKFNRTDLESSDFTSFRPTYCANRPMLVDVESHILSLKLNDVFTVFPDKDNSPMGYRIYKLRHEFTDTTTQTTEPYRNEFVITRKHLYKPPKINKPSMGGAQPATVVGAEGKAIYTNERGCIKVQFPWDRRGQHNEKSSCWLPVGQLLSDNGWGTQFIPRVGDEVIVDFLHDDPDQPVVIGSAYNGANPPIFPTDKTQDAISGYKTQLIGKKGLAGEGHELSFNDSAGKETLSLKSAGDLKFSAKHDLNWTTGGDETITINESDLMDILKGRGDIQAKSIHIKVGASSLTMDDNGIEFKPAGKLLLKAKNIEGEFPVVRLGDPYICPRITPVLVPHGMSNPITKGSPTFKLDAGLSVARVGDPISCTGETATITKGADAITVDGQPIAHLQSKIDHGGVMKQGSPTAFVSPRQPVTIETVKAPMVQSLKQDDIKDIIYITGDNSFYALTVQDADDLEVTAKPLMDALQKLWDATNSDLHDDKTIVAAKQDLNNTLKVENVINSPDDIEITEITHFIGSKRTYVPTSKMLKKWKFSQIDKDIQVDNVSSKIRLFLEKMKDPDNPKRISGKNVKNAIARVSGGSAVDIKIAEVDWSSTYKDFQTYVGGDNFNASAQAQLLRACAGGSMTGAWSPQKGKFSFSADGQATLDLAQGQLSTTCYIPGVQGFPLKVNLPNKEGQPRPLDLGAIRSALTLTAQGFVGASIAAGANLNMTLTQDGENNQLKANGNHKPNPNSTGNAIAKADADKTGLTTEANAFVGVKAGGEVGANIAWQNPEYKKPASTTTNDDATWTEFASLDVGGSASLGAGLGLEFSIGYNVNTGKFYIRAMANAVCGAGLSGDIAYVIEPKHIWEFVMFVYHKIKDQNFEYLGMFLVNAGADAFKEFTLMMTKYIVDEAFELEQATASTLQSVGFWWLSILSDIQEAIQHQTIADQTANNIINDPDKLKFTLPEVKGRLLTLLGTAPIPNESLHTAMLIILAYLQSTNDYNNVVQHLNLDGSSISVDAGRRKLHQLLGYDAGDYIANVPGFNKEFFVDADSITANIEQNTPVKTLLNVQFIQAQYQEILRVQAKEKTYTFMP